MVVILVKKENEAQSAPWRCRTVEYPAPGLACSFHPQALFSTQKGWHTLRLVYIPGPSSVIFFIIYCFIAYLADIAVLLLMNWAQFQLLWHYHWCYLSIKYKKPQGCYEHYLWYSFPFHHWHHNEDDFSSGMQLQNYAKMSNKLNYIK